MRPRKPEGYFSKAWRGIFLYKGTLYFKRETGQGLNDAKKKMIRSLGKELGVHTSHLFGEFHYMEKNHIIVREESNEEKFIINDCGLVG
jgi:hypothetical protein